MELAAVIWIYGLENICWDLEFMLGHRISIYWRLSWGVITPFLMIIIFIYYLTDYRNPIYGIHGFPIGFLIFGWAIFVFGLLQVIFWALLEFVLNCKKGQDIFEIIKSSFRPNEEWGPKNKVHKENWMQFKNEAINRRDTIMREKNHGFIKHKIYMLLGKYDKQLYTERL